MSEEPPEGADEGTQRGGRRRAARLAAGGAVAVIVVVAVALLRQPPDEPGGRVVLYGDSLSLEARGAFTEALTDTSGADVRVQALAGASPCDALGAMQQDVADPPDVAVIQFVGNNASPCTRGPGGEELTGDALAARTEADVRAAVELFAAAGSRVVLVGGPETPGLPGGASEPIADAYNRIVNEWAGRDLGRVRYADAAATVSGPDHAYVETLPCRGDEGEGDGCRDGEVTVRSPDRIHFCPSNELDDLLRCTVPSPGAERFGAEMARVARMALDPGY